MPRIWLDRETDSHPAEAGLAAPERRVGDSLSMTRRILLCQEQTPRCKRGRLPADVSLLQLSRRRHMNARQEQPDFSDCRLRTL